MPISINKGSVGSYVFHGLSKSTNSLAWLDGAEANSIWWWVVAAKGLTSNMYRGNGSLTTSYELQVSMFSEPEPQPEPPVSSSIQICKRRNKALLLMLSREQQTAWSHNSLKDFEGSSPEADGDSNLSLIHI